jgi:hypothetical protein
MSFLETRDAISICNRALSKIGQAGLSGSLTDPINRNKQAGRECALHYKSVVRTLLEAHFWGFGRKRATLAAITNDRSGEWLAAYQAPPDMAFPIMVDPDVNGVAGVAVSYYRGLGALIAKLYNRPMFRYEGSTIYAATATGVLDYSSYDVTEEDFTQAFEDRVVDFLAAKLAYSVAKDEAMGARFQKEAIQNLNLAIAHNLNLTQQRYDANFISDAELAREGVDPWIAGFLPYR